MITKENPVEIYKTINREIPSFLHETDFNLDNKTVDSFGEEWSKFKKFSDEEINIIAQNTYFDIIDESIVNEETVMADFGCGTGRWIKYFIPKAKKIIGIDPSKAIFVADKFLGKNDKVELCQASISNVPYPDEYFDFGMSIGVLHHIPDTKQALKDCVKKIKKGGHFYLYIYYSLDNRSFLFKSVWKASNILRQGVSKMPKRVKHFTCDFLAVTLYMPFVLFTRGLRVIGVPKKIRSKVPLSFYEDTSFYIIRNDSLDRFGTPLEQRFSKKQIMDMMHEAGLSNIHFSDKEPYWHAIGRKSN